jgi:hypothetical protein
MSNRCEVNGAPRFIRRAKMTEDEKFEAAVDAKLAEKRQADRANERAAVAAQMRQAAAMEHNRRINARHPIEGLGDPQAEEKRRRDMTARAQADFERMAAIHSRPVSGDLRAPGWEKKGGGAGFRGGPVAAGGHVRADGSPYPETK